MRKVFRVVRMLFYLLMVYIGIRNYFRDNESIFEYMISALALILALEYCVYIWYDGKATKR